MIFIYGNIVQIHQLNPHFCFSSGNRLTIRQLSDGKHLIQLVYGAKGELTDCEFGHQKNRVKTFLSSFRDDLKKLIVNSNVSVESLDGKPLPKQYGWLNYTLLRRQCHRRHLQMKEALSLDQEMINKTRKNDLWFER